MIDNKEYLNDNIVEVEEILNDNIVHRYFNIVLEMGILQHKKRMKLDGGYETVTYPAAKGFSRTQEIGNVFYNNKELWPDGLSVDIILTQKIPVIKIKNIILTIKSTKNPDVLWKNPKDYMKEYSKLNIGLTPQISMGDCNFEENSKKLKLGLGAKYYGILTYNLSKDDKVENMKVVFLSDDAKSVAHSVNIPVISSENKIIPENKSLKDEIKTIKGESLRKNIELK
ncbi:hypothetical protein [Clostridium sp.]|uniref:hypothetical protein n=1 Tax=Clostridium sp. TaxID=1506 RepID=UPI002914CA6D|nr:hypothetical protein [Clostridium sp.]MDU4726376.1 hypothetical protein [Clostridium sp.]